MLGTKELWCSFQPRQFNRQTAASCDQNDIQIYRKNCSDTIDIAWSMGIVGQSNIAIATTLMEANRDDQVRCLEKNLATLGSSCLFSSGRTRKLEQTIWRALQ